MRQSDADKQKVIYVYEFLKVPLIRAFGEETYNELCIAAEELRKNPIRFNHIAPGS